MATKLPKFKGSEEREEKDCGNRVAEIQGEREQKKGYKKKRIVAIKLPKMRRKKNSGTLLFNTLTLVDP